MNRLKSSGYAILFTICIVACTKKLSPSLSTPATRLRVLGYCTIPNDWTAGIPPIDFTTITDLNLAFLNPDSTGNFSMHEDLLTLINHAHDNRITVFASIGGGNPPSYMASLMERDRRDSFITNLVSFVQSCNFDGIDVDIENNLINAEYAPFVKDLATAVRSAKKLLTAALASWNSGLVADSTLAQYDFINIMSYDKTGPWDTTRPGQHAPFNMVKDDFNYFHVKRNIPAERLLIGVPFYGYGFGNNAPVSMSYKQIIAAYPGAENADEFMVAGGGTIYYNGISTIKQKVLFAKSNKAAGVMIWQLRGDSTGALSLLKAINESK